MSSHLMFFLDLRRGYRLKYSGRSNRTLLHLWVSRSSFKSMQDSDITVIDVYRRVFYLEVEADTTR